MKRESGILLPIFSLPSRFGIGCFDKEAYAFVDFLEKAGQRYWQVLPFGPTGFGDSPYQPFSAFAGNPYFISLEGLIEEGLLTWDECNGCDFGADQEKVDYGAQYNSRYKLLKIAFDRFCEKGLDDSQEFWAYKKKESYWLKDYAAFMSIKEKFEGISWLDWDPDYKKRLPSVMVKVFEELADSVDFIVFQQYEFDLQWRKLRKYANDKGIKIIGDIPFYIAMDSADTWAHPEAFEFDEELMPVSVAGCPPDAFSETGQLWGNPIYDWEARKADGYSWWTRRIERTYELCDVIRIDHFHGFDSYYEIPFEDETAENGVQKDGPGAEFFKVISKNLGKKLDIIAEDLGTITERTEKLLEDSGFPGMQVLEYAFDWSESSKYLTYNHEKNSVVYTGTHDNAPLRQWLEELNEHDRDFCRRFINSGQYDLGGLTWDIIREAYRSSANLCIIPLQDYLVKGREARMNEPGSFGTNWQWRLQPNFLSEELASSIYSLARLYGRLPKEDKEDIQKEEVTE